MATINGLTAAAMRAIRDGAIVGASVDISGHLILEKYDGGFIDSGSVIGPVGPTGPAGPVHILTELDDVDTAGADVGETLVFDGTNWVPVITQTPVGVVTPFAGAAAPTGYLLCDGAAVSRTTYSGLFAVVGTTYGVGDNSTTFNVPNLKGRIPVGRDAAQTEFDNRGETGGAKTVTLTKDQMPNHKHGFQGTRDPLGAGYQLSFFAAWNDSASTISVPPEDGASIPSTLVGGVMGQGGGLPHENMPPYLVLNYIIKV